MLIVRGLIAAVIVFMGVTLLVRVIAAAHGHFALMLPGIALGILLVLFGTYKLMQIMQVLSARL